MRAARRFYALALPVCAFVPLLATVGCQGRENTIDYAETEGDYLRYPAEIAKTTLPPGNGALFPLGLGSRWEMGVVQTKVQFASDGQRTLTPTGTGTETIRAVKQISLDGQKGMVFERTTHLTPRAGGPTKTTVLQEVYGVTKNGLYLMATSLGQERMTMSPPIPLLPYPPRIGQTTSWSGVLHYKNVSVPATCVSRFTSTEGVKPPSAPKGLTACRVDTVLTTAALLNSQNVPDNFLATRWLAPGIGLVQERLVSPDSQNTSTPARIVVTKAINSFEIKGK